MSDLKLDGEEVLDRVINRLITGPASMVDLYGACAFHCNQDQLDDAIAVLEDLRVLQQYRETRFNERVYIYALKNESRTWVICSLCKGVGVRSRRQGTCGQCRGDGMVTPRIPLEPPPRAEQR